MVPESALLSPAMLVSNTLPEEYFVIDRRENQARSTETLGEVVGSAPDYFHGCTPAGMLADAQVRVETFSCPAKSSAQAEFWYRCA